MSGMLVACGSKESFAVFKLSTSEIEDDDAEGDQENEHDDDTREHTDDGSGLLLLRACNSFVHTIFCFRYPFIPAVLLFLLK